MSMLGNWNRKSPKHVARRRTFCNRGTQRCQLRVEVLEQRQMLTVFAVDTDTDIDDGDISPGKLSVREAVRYANDTAGMDTITFDASLAGSTITLTEGELEITSSMTINGLGPDRLTISGGGVSRVFTEVGNGQRIITISDMTIADGLAPSSTGGGAVLFQRRGS